MASRSATVASRIRTGPGIAHGRRTFPFQRLDVPFHLQEDREECQDARVDVGAVARGARVLPRLVQQAVEHLAVLLPQRASIVHPSVQDRFEVQGVCRDGAAQGPYVRALRPPSTRRREGWPKLLARLVGLRAYSFVHRRILRRHARLSSGIPLKISRVTGPSYPRTFSAFASRSRSIVPFPNGKCSSPVSPCPPWLSCMCTSPRRSASAAREVRAAAVRLSRCACPMSRQDRRSGTASRTVRLTSGDSSTFSPVTTAPRPDAARTRPANHDAFVPGEIRGADLASMKCALKTWIPTASRTSMKPTKRARSAWWKCDGGRWAENRGSRFASASASAANFVGSHVSHVRSSSA